MGYYLKLFKLFNIFNMLRDFKNSEFKKTIGIKESQLKFIENIKGKKSRAGKLDEIIEFYKSNKLYDGDKN